MAALASMKADRRKALVLSYFFLCVFVVFFLTPPVYMLITSLKSNAEISAAAAPWWVLNPTLENYFELLTTSTYLTFFRNSAVVSLCSAPERWDCSRYSRRVLRAPAKFS